MRKNILIVLLIIISPVTTVAQKYSFTFKLEGVTDSVLYLGQHYRDNVRIMDTARAGKGGTYTFKGARSWERGIYTLIHQDGSKTLGDFTIDGETKFTLSGDARLSAASMKTKGSKANKYMYDYMRTMQEARKTMDSLREAEKDPLTKESAEKAQEALVERMERFEDDNCEGGKKMYRFQELVCMFLDPEVDDTVSDKATYYRMHYWDNVDFTDHSLTRTPQMFNKMNYFFFGMLYRAESDTICAALDRLMDGMKGDTLMMRYVLDFITPKYYRSTRNIGWDAVWCHIAKNYYLEGRCPWETEGNLYNMRYNYNRISKSLIGCRAQELWMLDTTQIDAPEHWRSSHRFPERYVILWFWDPDCHHCQEQTEELIKLYNNMAAEQKATGARAKRFEVYAIGYESDVDKWKEYVKKHQLPFVNVGGTNVNIDYQEAYNVHGAPTMIILNEQREIIMNKVLPVKSLMQFFDEYEKQQTNRESKNQ